MKQVLLQIQMNNSNIYRDTNLNILQLKIKNNKQSKLKYEKIVALTQKINQKNAAVRKDIEKQCELINETLNKLKQKSKQYMNCCLEALTQDKKNCEVVCVTQLASYLKMQKQLLKSLAESKEAQSSNKVDLHNLLGKVELERTLRKLKKQQLQEQIKFLQSNVLVKGNFIYNPASSLLISPTEEKENLARLQNLVNELERVIKLSIPCAVYANNQNKLGILHDQQKRINDCERILEEEHSKLLKFTQFVEQSRNFSDKFSYGQPYLKDLSSKDQVNNEYDQLIVNEFELDSILEMETLPSLTINFEHPFNDIESSISDLRARVKKIEKSL